MKGSVGRRCSLSRNQRQLPRPPSRDVPADVLVALESQLVVANEAPSVPDVLALDEMQFPALDLDAMKDRYPLLRNAL